jgi:hypothetical protein
MNHRECLELVVVDVGPVDTELLQIDRLGWTAVELDDVRAIRTGHDRRRPEGHAAV